MRDYDKKLELNLVFGHDTIKYHEKVIIGMDYYTKLATRRKFKTIWSLFEVGSNMFKSAIVNPNGNPIVVAYNGGLGEGGQVKLSLNPTWLTVWSACDKLITQSGDDYHIFIESLDIEGNTLHLIAGS